MTVPLPRGTYLASNLGESIRLSFSSELMGAETIPREDPGEPARERRGNEPTRDASMGMTGRTPRHLASSHCIMMPSFPLGSATSRSDAACMCARLDQAIDFSLSSFSGRQSAGQETKLSGPVNKRRLGSAVSQWRRCRQDGHCRERPRARRKEGKWWRAVRVARSLISSISSLSRLSGLAGGFLAPLRPGGSLEAPRERGQGPDTYLYRKSRPSMPASD